MMDIESEMALAASLDGLTPEKLQELRERIEKEKQESLEEFFGQLAVEEDAAEEREKAEYAAALVKARAKAQETIAEYKTITGRDLIADYKAEQQTSEISNDAQIINFTKRKQKEFTEQREKEKAERARKKAEAEVAEKTARERQPFTDAIKRPLPGGRLALQFDFHPGKFESRDAEWNCEWESVWKSIGCGLSYKKLWQLTLITTPALAERYLTRDGKLSLHR